jgi:polar amino acid transport system substrate-binding protein
MGTPKKNGAGGRYLHAFVEELKRSGFVGAVLKRSGQRDATLAPPEPPPKP